MFFEGSQVPSHEFWSLPGSTIYSRVRRTVSNMAASGAEYVVTIQISIVTTIEPDTT